MLAVDYKAGVALDGEYLVRCSVTKKAVDKKGRTRVTVRAELLPAIGALGEAVPLSVGGATFVIVPQSKWPGQALQAGPKPPGASRLKGSCRCRARRMGSLRRGRNAPSR